MILKDAEALSKELMSEHEPRRSQARLRKMTDVELLNFTEAVERRKEPWRAQTSAVLTRIETNHEGDR